MNPSVELPSVLCPPTVVERPKGSGTFVRLNKSILHAIVYLGWARDSGTEIDPEGTGFFVRYGEAYYIVTAAHVAKALDDCFDVRMTLDRYGAGHVEHLAHGTWYFHQDDKVDIAVLPFLPPPWAQNNAFHVSRMLGARGQHNQPGPGDLVYVVGIFKLLPGEKKNNPVVHVGHLASWAEGEEVPVRDWRVANKNAPALKVNAYLVQVPTLSQASGSPVFIREVIEAPIPTLHAPPDHRPMVASYESARRSLVYGDNVDLLGLWHGAWLQPEANEIGLEIPLGMGIVIPAHQIRETLDQPELAAMREKAKMDKERTNTVTPQSASHDQRRGD